MNKKFRNFMSNQSALGSEYLEDGRRGLKELYRKFLELDSGWIKEVIFWQKTEDYEIPVLAFRTKTKGKALWLFAGIHGEEPAGPNALCESIALLKEFEQKKIPMVIIPMCNPVGYLKNWRYPNEYRDSTKGASVGDSEHLLLDKNQRPRREAPISEDAHFFTKAVLKYIKARPPALLMDFHEDEDQKGVDALSYIYSQGELGVHDPIALMVVGILHSHDVQFKENGRTRFNDLIVNGIVNATNDGSVDELLAATQIYVNNKIVTKHSCHSVIVVETPTVDVPLEKRVKAQKEIMKDLESFFLIL